MLGTGSRESIAVTLTVPRIILVSFSSLIFSGVNLKFTGIIIETDRSSDPPFRYLVLSDSTLTIKSIGPAGIG